MQEAMNVKRLLVRLKARPSKYEITIGSGTLGKVGDEVRRSVVSARRIALMSNRTVFALYGRTVLGSLRSAGFDVSHWLMPDGERRKNMRTLERALQFFSSIGLERGDAVVAMGGGVVGDLAGMAAALHLRGVPFFQVPTTLLAQIDASIGGKTAVNSRHGKNMIGLIQQPLAVLIDPDVLCTLPRRGLTAGWCEAIKQGAAGSQKLFANTRRFLTSARQLFANQQGERLSQLITAHCSFKARIVKNDEREDVASTAGAIRWVLLERIGRARVVDARDVPRRVVSESIRAVLR